MFGLEDDLQEEISTLKKKLRESSKINKEKTRRTVSNFAKDFSKANNLDFKESFDYMIDWINKNIPNK